MCLAIPGIPANTISKIVTFIATILQKILCYLFKLCAIMWYFLGFSVIALFAIKYHIVARIQVTITLEIVTRNDTISGAILRVKIIRCATIPGDNITGKSGTICYKIGESNIKKLTYQQVTYLLVSKNIIYKIIFPVGLFVSLFCRALSKSGAIRE